MTRSMTVVESRAAPTSETISFPILTYSDTSGLSDPHDSIKEQVKRRHNQVNLAQSASQRPRTAHGRTNKRPPPGGGAAFDFQLTTPPDEAVALSFSSSRSPVGHHTIGIALGSPGVIESRESFPPPNFNTSIFDPKKGEESIERPKTSKWKKIGGLFRTKNALSSLTHQPRDDQQKKQSHKEDSSATPQPLPPKQPSILTEEWSKVELDSKHATGDRVPTAPRSRVLSLPRKTTKDKNSDGLMLNVDIPDVEMERYSVMFGDVMNKNQTPSLLARRSKTLGNLRMPNNKDFLSAKIPPIPKRRATSPGHSNLSLFPTPQPSKGAQGIGTQNFSRSPSPLLRSHTLPVESPSKISSGLLPPTFDNTREMKPLPSINAEPTVYEAQMRANSPRIIDIPKLSRRGTVIAQEHAKTRRGREETALAREDRPVLQTRENQSKVSRAIQSRSSRLDMQSEELANITDATNLSTRPRLTILTTDCTGPPPPAKDKSPSGLSSNSINASFPKGAIELSASPVPISADPQSGTTSSGVSVCTPLTEDDIGSEERIGRARNIEISTARSISVSKNKQQVLVPVGARVDRFDSNERFVVRKPLTLRITDVQPQHKHAVSQELQIESV